jgi:hypothetical protein
VREIARFGMVATGKARVVRSAFSRRSRLCEVDLRSLNRLTRHDGAGEGIRTLDPDLGKFGQWLNIATMTTYFQWFS